MPTYTVYSRAGTLSRQQIRGIAELLTRCHSDVTGAPASFVQVVFQNVPEGSHFIGGHPADTRAIYVGALVRAGRSADVRSRLITGIRDSVAAVACVPRHQVWVYLTELRHTDMVEFGEVLPEPGHEQPWIAQLPPEVRAHLEER